jgi:hypothetical protein
MTSFVSRSKNVSSVGDMAIAGFRKINLRGDFVRYYVTSTCIFHTIIHKYLRRCVATNAAISVSVRVGTVEIGADAVRSVFARQDTSGTLAFLSLATSMRPRPSSSDNSVEKGECASRDDRT